MTSIISKRNTYLLIFSFLFVFQLYSQNEKELIERKNSISLNLFGTSGIVGVTYERLLFNHIGLEAGFGLYGFGGGITYYPLVVQNNKINPYVGIKYNQIIVLVREATYVPLGITYTSKWNVNFGADIGLAYYPEKQFGSNAPLFSIKEDSNIGYLWNVKIGYRF